MRLVLLRVLDSVSLVEMKDRTWKLTVKPISVGVVVKKLCTDCSTFHVSLFNQEVNPLGAKKGFSVTPYIMRELRLTDQSLKDYMNEWKELDADTKQWYRDAAMEEAEVLGLIT